MILHRLQLAWRQLRPSRYRTLNRIEVSGSALRHNLALVRSQHPGFEVWPVLKGNAYGHGISQVARALAADSSMLVVDGYHEAQQVHAVTNQHVLVMGYIHPSNVRLLGTRRCSYVVQDQAGLQAFAALDKPLNIHLELNTGMNRLGLAPAELEGYLKVLASYPKLHLEGVMTHVADADNPSSNEASHRQQTVFDEQVGRILAAGFRPRFIHIAQTAGSTKVVSRYANAIRLGIGTYGINPLEPADPAFTQLVGFRPALELKSTIIKTVELAAGDSVSYNFTFTARRPMRIGVLPLGYYEGVSRSLSNRGCVTYQGKPLPMVGRICMNHTMVDLSGTHLEVGDEVTVIAADPRLPNSVSALQTQFGLFAYSTLTGLSSSIRRNLV